MERYLSLSLSCTSISCCLTVQEKEMRSWARCVAWKAAFLLVYPCFVTPSILTPRSHWVYRRKQNFRRCLANGKEVTCREAVIQNPASKFHLGFRNEIAVKFPSKISIASLSTYLSHEYNLRPCIAAWKWDWSFFRRWVRRFLTWYHLK